MLNNKKVYKKFWQVLNKYNSFLITSHIGPDGDAIASQILIGYILKNMKKKYNIVVEDPLPEKYRFVMEKYFNIVIPELLTIPHTVDLLTQLPENYFPEVIIILDTCGKEKLGNFHKYFKSAKAIISVDHHIGKRQFKGAVDIIDKKASATGEILYDLLEVNNYSINKDIANLIYIAIVSDTKFFTQLNTTSRTHYIISKLIEAGVSPEKISLQLNEIAFDTLKIFGKVLSRSKKDKSLIWSYVTKSELSKCKDNGVDGLVELLRDTKDSSIAILFKEINRGKTKVSFRGKKGMDVFKFAQRCGGGGHKQAAGCTINKSLKETMEYILKLVSKEILS